MIYLENVQIKSNLILKLLQDQRDPWVEEVLTHYNKYVDVYGVFLTNIVPAYFSLTEPNVLENAPDNHDPHPTVTLIWP